VAYALVQKFNELWKTSTASPRLPLPVSEADYFQKVNPYAYQRRETSRVNLAESPFGGKELVRVGLALGENSFNDDELRAIGVLKRPIALPVIGVSPADDEATKVEFLEMEHGQYGRPLALSQTLPVARNWKIVPDIPPRQPEMLLLEMNKFHAEELKPALDKARTRGAGIEAIFSTAALANGSALEKLQWLVNAASEENFRNWSIGIDLRAGGIGETGLARAFVAHLDKLGANVPVIWRYRVPENYSAWLTDASSQIGGLLCDGFGDAIVVYGDLPLQHARRFSYNLLQATRLRISKTEFISCPSCGRTQFNLQTTTERIKQKTGHLKGVKIAIMGCIVNGPGEMADADFGYVGTGPKKINLYVGKEIVERNIPEELADEKLIELIKKQGRWVEP
jgi:(E)-4-hydroxy-3-methylbut-2-enyl-diphosphate synthase